MRRRSPLPSTNFAQFDRALEFPCADEIFIIPYLPPEYMAKVKPLFIVYHIVSDDNKYHGNVRALL